MLDTAIADQLKSHLAKVVTPIELVAYLDESPKSAELRDLLTEVAGLSDSVAFRVSEADALRRPAFDIVRAGTDTKVTFAGIPMGHEFTSFVLALLQVGGYPPRIDDSTREQAQALSGTFHFETFFSLTCQNCPDVVQALNILAVLNPAVTSTSIDGALNQAEVEGRGVLAVPTVFLNGEVFGQGRMSLEEILAKLDTGAESRAAAEIAQKDPYEVLVIGGGPAGASAAIYTARKGIRTGVAAERFGGQVLDTMGIENFISVSHTEGPKLAAALENHVADYEVDLMRLQRAVALRGAEGEGGLIEIDLANGATLRSRSVVLSTGARWRTMGVPGEEEYRNKGVTFCPHCDGPLFKGKRVAVVGGGNSGIEAAIDLAGIVGHVTVIEFLDVLRADEVLQRKLRSLANVDVIMNARTTQVDGDGARVTGLQYEDRTTGEIRSIALEGIFVQIGLLPNTEWLEGTVALSPRGEIEIDAAGRTSVPGVFAAGDCTTVPYKQIVVAMGAGATAGLSAFDYLIRTPVAVL